MDELLNCFKHMPNAAHELAELHLLLLAPGVGCLASCAGQQIEIIRSQSKGMVETRKVLQFRHEGAPEDGVAEGPTIQNVVDDSKRRSGRQLWQTVTSRWNQLAERGMIDSVIEGLTIHATA